MEIEKGVEIPPKRRSKMDFLLQMDVGDSFLWQQQSTSRVAAGTCDIWAKRRNLLWKFSQRTTSEGLRIWRIK